MLSLSKDLPAVREMLDIAQQVLGYDLLERCTNGEPASMKTKYRWHADSISRCRNCGQAAARCTLLLRGQWKGFSHHDVHMHAAGPKSVLDDTETAQPALFVAGLAASERLRCEVGCFVLQRLLRKRKNV